MTFELPFQVTKTLQDMSEKRIKREMTKSDISSNTQYKTVDMKFIWFVWNLGKNRVFGSERSTCLLLIFQF